MALHKGLGLLSGQLVKMGSDDPSERTDEAAEIRLLGQRFCA
jgi:hypothetical protein